MRHDLARLRAIERWVGWVRLAAVPFAIFQVSLGSGYPSGYERWAWVTTGLFAAGTLLLFWLGRREREERAQRVLGAVALSFDFAVVSAYVLIYSFGYNQFIVM